MATVKNFSSVELNDNQKRVLRLGQGFVVSKLFHSGNFLEDWNKLKNKIRWGMFFHNDSSTSVIYPYRRSTSRHAPVGSDHDSKLVENFCVTSLHVTSSELQGIKELISNPNITVLMQYKSKQLVVIDTEECESKMKSILQDRSQYCQVEIDLSQEFKSNVTY